MRKFILILILILVFTGGGFIAGYRYFIKTNIAAVLVKNSSSRPVMSIRIVHDGGEVVVAGLKKKKERRIRFFSKESGTYRISATFDNDRTIESEKRHFDPGDTAKEVVTDSTIIGGAS